MTVTMIGTGTIMMVIMMAIAPCTAQEKMTPSGHPVPITETGTDLPTEIEKSFFLRGPIDQESMMTHHRPLPYI